MLTKLKQNRFFTTGQVMAAASAIPSPSARASSPGSSSSLCNGGIKTDFGCFSVNDPSFFTSKLYEIGLGFIGGVALIFIVWGGYQILTSQGDIEKLQKGRSYIVSSVIGLVLAISGFAFYQIVATDILKIPGFK